MLSDDLLTRELLRLAEDFGASPERCIEAFQSAETIVREMQEWERNFQGRTGPVVVLGISCG